MFAEQVRTSLLTAWLVVSAVLLAVLAAPFILPPQTIFSLAPKCQWKTKYGRECPLCGMTTSFVLISRGRFDDALDRNRGSIPLYSAMVWNECVALWYTIGGLRRNWERAGRRQRRFQTEECSCKS
jgi:hypothetical protein